MNKFCVTCRFVIDAKLDGYERCSSTDVSGINPVTGRAKWQYCGVARGQGGACGPHGKFWQSNAEPATFTPEERKLLMTALEEGRI